MQLARALVDSLKRCAKAKDLLRGSRLHAHALRHGLLASSPYVAASLINMYAKCGMLAEAHGVLRQVPAPNVVAWNALITGYVHDGRGREALECLESMQRGCMPPDAVTFICSLKACASLEALGKGKQIHSRIAAMMNRGSSWEKEKNDAELGNALVDMYAKCGALEEARRVLRLLPARDVVSWSALIAGYASKGHGDEAIGCFEQMQREGIPPDEVAFISVLKACGSVGAADRGIEVHEAIVRNGMLVEKQIASGNALLDMYVKCGRFERAHNVALGNALLDMYVKCGRFERARDVLEDLPVRNVVSWSALIAGYADAGRGRTALECFELMRIEGLAPNDVTFVGVLKACGSLGDVETGERIHGQIEIGMLEGNVVLGNALVDMHAKCGRVARARQVLEELPVRDIVSWSALIAGYAQSGHGQEALDCFAQMQREGHFPVDVTLICALQACGSIRAAECGKQIHGQMIGWGSVEKSIMVGNVLVDMYARCGELAEARVVLRSLPLRDVVSWNAMIAGYARAEKGCRGAMDCFVAMQREGICPNAITFLSVLKACGSAGAADKGHRIHDRLLIDGRMLEQSTVLGTALVDMYARCGLLTKAQETLERLPARNLVSWNSLISGYAREGHLQAALGCFERLQNEGSAPDEITILSILNACAHSGNLDEARWYYENMNDVYGIEPGLEHHTCMVVMLGCAGRFEEAMSVMRTMPCCDDPSVWLALLGTCKKWGNVELGRLAFDEIAVSDAAEGPPPAAYILMAGIYTAAGMPEDAERIDALRAGSGRQSVVEGM